MIVSKRLGNHHYSEIMVNCQPLTPKFIWQVIILGAMLMFRHYQYSKISHMACLTLDLKIAWQVEIVLKHRHCSMINHMDYLLLIPMHSGNTQEVSNPSSFITKYKENLR